MLMLLSKAQIVLWIKIISQQANPACFFLCVLHNIYDDYIFT